MITSFKAKGNPVKQYAEQNSIECRDWPSLISDGAKIKYDLGVVVSFGHLIPESIINMFPLYVQKRLLIRCKPVFKKSRTIFSILFSAV